jgi:hypothetical protein
MAAWYMIYVAHWSWMRCAAALGIIPGETYREPQASSGKLDRSCIRYYIGYNRKDKMRILKKDLTWYFIRPHEELPASYLKSCNKFFRELSSKHQAASVKPQALKNKLHYCGRRVKNRFNRKV